MKLETKIGRPPLPDNERAELILSGGSCKLNGPLLLSLPLASLPPIPTANPSLNR